LARGSWLSGSYHLRLLGAGTVVFPAGLNDDGNAVGPAFYDQGLAGGMSTHMDIRPE
jgi:hypothetical protein